ncbi:SAVED domain-containing protein [Sorangium cellulosum]|uniref:SAVED domain-containing protein n=1 Tax=Sorangium cellulosum TaxID=56 RepID=UPI001011CA19|nr:SAVED domain-containing protein [Sorangium cellulosum]
MSLSAAGAALQGHDYQHLFAWYHALRALSPTGDVTGIEIEAKNAGNVDDVVVRRRGAADEHYQVKYSVDGRRPIDNAWWVTPATAGGKSPLQRFWQSWQTLSRGGQRPWMGLYTNRPLDVSDKVLALQDGRTGTLGPRLRLATPGSKAGRGRKRWASHLGVAEADLIEMLDHLVLLTGQSGWAGLVTSVADRMAAVGLRSDELAVEQGVQAIRAWVTGARCEVDRQALLAEIARRGLRGEARQATVVVQALARDPWAAGATECLDWVDLFEGDHPRTRRQLRDPRHWNGRLLPELEAAEQRIRALGFDRVLVRGDMRLPAWFATGVAFGDTRNVRVARVQGGQRWASDVAPGDFPIHVAAPVDLGDGDELAVALCATGDITKDVLAYLRGSVPAVGRFVAIAAAPAPSPTSIPDAARAMGWALATRQAVREQVGETGARKVHLFLSCPAGAALFLGHVWNRIPSTQLYEDLSPGYTPAFLIPG